MSSLFITITPEEAGLILTALEKLGDWLIEAPSTAEHHANGVRALDLAIKLKGQWQKNNKEPGQ